MEDVRLWLQSCYRTIILVQWFTVPEGGRPVLFVRRGSPPSPCGVLAKDVLSQQLLSKMASTSYCTVLWSWLLSPYLSATRFNSSVQPSKGVELMASAGIGTSGDCCSIYLRMISYIFSISNSSQ